ncbi:MAG: FAD-binding oxidoreductase [Gammaproteobacteria bacterium]|nr:FAD-binding oxidoreductase [Gammaproteobacteria bacterium]MDH3538325.1 FAD-binding oxidoreductase [Gammaproteobacteria bacterium]
MQPPAQELPASADVVVVGAGIAGICATWYLNRAGLSVVVCEKGVVAGEQSSRNWGWCRQQGRDQAELPIVIESLRLWQEIADEVGIDIGYRREGSLYLCENDAEMANHDRFMAFAPDYGLETRRLNRRQLEALMADCPARWQSALYTPDDARAEPALAVPAMAQTLRARGVPIIENCAVEEIVTQNNAVSEVVTERGAINTAAVLVAAGSWSTFLLKACGIRLPQLTVKASVARTAPAPLLFNGNASGSKVSFRRRLDGGYTVASSDYLEVFPSISHLGFLPDFLPLIRASLGKLRLRIPELKIDANYTRHRVLNPLPTAKTVARIRARLADRVPALRDIELVEAWSGMIDALPDVVPVLDKSDRIDGLWISTGFSGHGFGIGPGAGKLMADLVQNKSVEYDLNRFRLARFGDGSPTQLGPLI